MKLIVTVDTEEDGWGAFRPDGHTVENIRRIPPLQDLFDSFGVLPTYLVTYPVATQSESVAALKPIWEQGRCEIGTHVHPWSTPPFEEATNQGNSMLCNLPADLQFRKIACLHETITKNFGIVPTAFRAGRWGYGRDVAHALEKIGYRVDSSVFTLMDWTAERGPDCSAVFADPYYFNPPHPFTAHPAGPLLEVPVTAGFLQHNARRANAVFRFLTKRPGLHLIGVLARLRLLNKIYLFPENFSGAEMIALARAFIERDAPFLHLFFHSPTLQPGLTPLVQTEADRLDFLGRIRTFLAFVKDAGIASIRLSDATASLPRC